LQCDTACCNQLQRVAVCCSVLQCVVNLVCLQCTSSPTFLTQVCVYVAACCSVLQYVAVCCSVVKIVCVCCSVLQCVAVCCSVLQCGKECGVSTMHLQLHTSQPLNHFSTASSIGTTFDRTLQHTATKCQRAAIHCNAIQNTATQRNTLQHKVKLCNTLQYSNIH